MSEHVFVAMPFGQREGLNFDRIYADYIEPALKGLGFRVLRADQERQAGDIYTDMFQELLLADLVVVDVSVDNPNVWYELGVRHALRRRGVIQVNCRRDHMPFDVYGQRTLRYRVKDGVPDPDTVEKDREALASFARETLDDWKGRPISPVYQVVPALQEPNWKKLRMGGVNEFWDALNAWSQRIDVARHNGKPGDILVYADEVPTRYLRLEAHLKAGKALLGLQSFDFALEQYEKALASDPDDLGARQGKGITLGRLGRHGEAAVWLQAAAAAYPNDGETLGLLGRVKKDAWLAAWQGGDRTPEERRQAAADAAELLREAFEHYRHGFCVTPDNYYPGINALTLLELHHHLTGRDPSASESAVLAGAVRWVIAAALEKKRDDYWARVSRAEIDLLHGDAKTVRSAYQHAVAVAQRDRFNLDSSRQQVVLLRDLGFRPAETEAALAVLNHALAEAAPPDPLPQRVFLFSGHMVDRPDREVPRFPADREPVAALAIAEQLDRWGAEAGDLAICGGAAGGDLLFAEAALARGLRLELHIPFREPEFLNTSVSFAGDAWQDRWYQVRANRATKLFVMPDHLGPPQRGADPFARNNLWQLYTALSLGTQRLHFLCLWNRAPGDGPGGTQHMHEIVRRRTGKVKVLDTTMMW